MDAEYWIGELGRLYLRSDEAIQKEQFESVEPMADEFNQALEQLQEEFADNPIIEGTKEVDAYRSPPKGVIGGATRRDQALHEVRSRSEKIANAIGYELPEPEPGSSSTNRMVMVQVDQRQEAKQEVTQEVTVNQIQQTIQSLPRSPDQKEELQKLLDEFEQELNGSQDISRLRSILSKVGEISKDVAAQMATRALTYGITGILGLNSIN